MMKNLSGLLLLAITALSLQSCAVSRSGSGTDSTYMKSTVGDSNTPGTQRIGASITPIPLNGTANTTGPSPDPVPAPAPKKKKKAN